MVCQLLEKCLNIITNCFLKTTYAKKITRMCIILKTFTNICKKNQENVVCGKKKRTKFENVTR